MSTIGDAGRLPLAIVGNHATDQAGRSLQSVIEDPRRLDELSSARVIEYAAELVHKAQVGGQPLGTLSQKAIVIQPDGTVKLAAAPSLAHTAPEVLRGQAGDRRSDVFSLGVVLWEALAHAALFDGATDETRKTAVLEQEVRPASEMNANVPAELDAICKKALARDPADRYQSAKVMAAEISAVLDDAGYPETNEQIVRYLDGALPRGPRTPPFGSAAGPSPPSTLPPPIATVAPAKPLSPGAFLPSSLGVSESATAATAATAAAAPRPPTLPPNFAATAILGSNAVLPTLAPAATAAAESDLPTLAANLATAAASLSPPAPSAPLIPSRVPAPAIGFPAISSPASTPPAASPPAPLASLPAPAGKPSISNAETIATPALVPSYPVAPPAPVAATPVSVSAASPSSLAPPGLGPIPGLAAASPSTTVPATLGSASSSPVEGAGDPGVAAGVVSLPRAASEGGVVQRDVLAGWGWTTGATAIIDDGEQYEDDTPKANRKRVFIAMGAGAGAILLFVIIAIAAGGSKPSTDKSKLATTPAATPRSLESTEKPQLPATNPATTPTIPEPAPPAAPDPAPTTTTVPAPATTAVEPAQVEPAQVEPAKVEPVKVEPAQVEPAQVEPAQVEPAKAELAKAEPPPPIRIAHTRKPKKSEPKKVAEAAPVKPVDPYAVSEKKPDPAVAYKAGFQQLARGNTPGALATFRASLSLNPGYAPTWRGLGLVYEKLGQKTQARNAFKRYLQLSPGAGDAAQIRERLGRL